AIFGCQAFTNFRMRKLLCYRRFPPISADKGSYGSVRFWGDDQGWLDDRSGRPATVTVARRTTGFGIGETGPEGRTLGRLRSKPRACCGWIAVEGRCVLRVDGCRPSGAHAR